MQCCYLLFYEFSKAIKGNVNITTAFETRSETMFSGIWKLIHCFLFACKFCASWKSPQHIFSCGLRNVSVQYSCAANLPQFTAVENGRLRPQKVGRGNKARERRWTPHFTQHWPQEKCGLYHFTPQWPNS